MDAARTTTASMLTSSSSHRPPTFLAKKARDMSFSIVSSLRRVAKMHSKMKVMFSIETLYHMFRNVFGNTPGRCSSTKFAELSKPLTPSMALEKPRTTRCESREPPPVNLKFACRFSTTISNGRMPRGRTMATNPTVMRTAMVARWNVNIQAATFADSEIPHNFRRQKHTIRLIATGMVWLPSSIGSCFESSIIDCRYDPADNALTTAVAM
mmetsp:Transcript_75306/g.213005  ORF Transcript_75306/g.213005 Transcript_75306/m.213005 type:complete len:211 (-) Transcript_75306:563-1195(-)